MRLASFRAPDARPGWGIITEAGVVDLSDTCPSLRAALAQGDPVTPRAHPVRYALDEITFCPPIPDPDKILCVGLNYRSHIAESKRELPDRPVIFTRFANTQIGHSQPMICPKLSSQLDFEGELAVIIGKRGRYLKREQALDHVAGFSCYNDGSVRDWQRHTHQFTPGKNFVGTGGFGPWIATVDEIPDVRELTLLTRVNGEEMQHATLDDLIFDVGAILEYCSSFTELVPGDVILTGTPGGVGAARVPPLWLKPGDVVEVEISRIGVLSNRVEAESGVAP